VNRDDDDHLGKPLLVHLLESDSDERNKTSVVEVKQGGFLQGS
jgi:hypothetical protein